MPRLPSRESQRVYTNLHTGCQASERAELRIERIPQRIAEEVEGEDGQADRDAWEDAHPRRGLGNLDGRAPQHQSPGRRGLLDAQAQKGQRGLEQDRLAE